MMPALLGGDLTSAIGQWRIAHGGRALVQGTCAPCAGDRVCAEGADAMSASWQQGHLVQRDATHTIADGIAVRLPVPEALADMRGTVDDVLLVSESAIERAMRLVFTEAGLIAEPAGVVGIAAVLEHPSLRSQRLAAVLCGSNLTAEQVACWLR